MKPLPLSPSLFGLRCTHGVHHLSSCVLALARVPACVRLRHLFLPQGTHTRAHAHEACANGSAAEHNDGGRMTHARAAQRDLALVLAARAHFAVAA
eukprot:2927854-Pleurochrysis_carterae.AAC.3